jgi:hypothetical protein
VATSTCGWSVRITRCWWSEKLRQLEPRPQPKDHRDIGCDGPAVISAKLLVAPWSLMAMFVMHGFAVKLGAMFSWTLAARWHGSLVALAIVEMMIDVSVEMT